MTFIVGFWAAVFSWLELLSTFAVVRGLFPKLHASYRFVDAWVLGHLLLSAGSVILVAKNPDNWLGFLFVLYGALRVFEINVYQVNVLLFDEYRAKKNGTPYAVRGFRRLVLLLMHNYFEIVFWFACSYIYFAESFAHTWQPTYRTVLGAIYGSFITMSTFGDFNFKPADFFGAFVLFTQSVCGLFMTILCLARFIALLPRPTSMDEMETRPDNK